MLKQPISSKVIIRLLLITVIVLAFAAGYYHSAYHGLLQKYQKLEKTVTASSQPGR